MQVDDNPKPLRPAYIPRRDKCSACKNPVFLAERILVESKIFHRTCFSCARCGAQLNPDSCDYYECESGEYCCEFCESFANSENNSDFTGKSQHSDILAEETQNIQQNVEINVIEISDSDPSSGEDLDNIPNVRRSVVSDRLKFFENNMLSASGVSGKSASDSSNYQFMNNALIASNVSTESDVVSEDSVSEASKEVSKSTISEDLNVSSEPNTDISVTSDQSKLASNNDSVLTVSSSCSKPITISSSSFDDNSNTNISSNNSLSLQSKDENEGGRFVSTLNSIENDSILRKDNKSFGLDDSFVIPQETSVLKTLPSDQFSIEPNIFTASTINESELKDDAEVSLSNADVSLSNAEVALPNGLEISKNTDDELVSSNMLDEVEVVNETSDLEVSLENASNKSGNDGAVEKLDGENFKIDNDLNNEEEYPEELNPFGEDENTSDLDISNPFFEDLVGNKDDITEPATNIANQNTNSVKPHQRRKIPADNPFWSDGEIPSSDEENEMPVPAPRSLTSVPKASPRVLKTSENSHNGFKNIQSSPSPSKRKKQPAPQPPVQSSPSKPAARKARPAPLPPVAVVVQSPNNKVLTSTPMFEEEAELKNNFSLAKCDISNVKISSASEWEKLKSDKEENNRTRKSCDGLPNNKHLNNDRNAGKWKRKKGPAPPMPVIRRSVTPLPIADIKHELEIIELQQQGLEKQGVKLEQMIRLKCEGSADISDNSTRSIETATASMTDDQVDDLVLQLFEIVNEKNELFRRQAQLMYMRRQQRLEEEHADLEYQIRCLMAQPETNRTDSDKQLEEQLISRLLEVVSMRNEVVDCLEMDRVRAVEEDHSISTRLESYTAQREQQSDDLTSKSLNNSPIKLSKKEKKKEKEKRKLKKLHNKKQDVDKDIDEMELSESLRTSKNSKDRKKLKWFS